MANPFFFASMEQPGLFPSGAAANTQQNTVLYVAPLRIVAPPGVPPYLPHSFDPVNAFSGHPLDLFPQTAGNGLGSKIDDIKVFGNGNHGHFGFGTGDHAQRDFCKVDQTPINFSHGDQALRDFCHRDPARNCFSNGYQSHADSSHAYNRFHNGNHVPNSENIKPGSTFSDNNQAHYSGNVNHSFRDSAQVVGEGTPTLKKSTSSSLNRGKSGKFKVSAVRDLPFGCSKSCKSRNTHTEVSNHSYSREHSVDGKTLKRGRDSKPKRCIPIKRPPTNGVSSGIPPHKAVMNILRLYDALRRNVILEEERKSKDANKGCRPDLISGSVINTRSLAVNRSQKVVGHVPGIEIGDQYFFRMEICCVGLHGPIQAGIEYLTTKESEYKTPVAISIISSGGYDAKDAGEELIYTGQGGKSALDRKWNDDQKLERGNLAMEGSMKYHVPVRVTRGIKDTASPSGKTYTYDGLYMVEQCWSEKGKFGFEEFKFKLRRIPGQAELGSAILKLSNSLKYKPSEREGLRVADIAKGKEGLPVCVVNSVDNEQSPPPFDYSTSLQYPHELSYQQFGCTQGCNCEGICDPSQACYCCVANSSVCAYLNDGTLVKERSVIYECGSNCSCSFGCKNRLTQRALKYRLEVFKTQDRGWGLRSWDTIPAGSFICEYTGKIIQNPHSLTRRDYVLDLSRLPKNNPSWGDVSSFLEVQAAQVTLSAPRPDLIIDSSQIGNAARFINHSCSPNVLVQCILRDHQDTKRPHLMLFAMDNIPPFRELTIDYASELPTSAYVVSGKPCLCKSEQCKGTFYE